MYEFRWEWAAGDEHRRLFVGETREEVLEKVAHCLRTEMGVQKPTQTLMRLVALQTRRVSESELPRRWAWRSPLVRRQA